MVKRIAGPIMNKKTRQKQEKEQLAQIVGANLRVAREINGFTRKKVMQDIFMGDGYNLNRISELENGDALPSVPLLLKLSVYYNVNMDFLMGRTHQPDFLSEDAYVGRAVADLRNLGLDMMDKVTVALLEQIKSLPSIDSMALLDNAKQLIFALLQCQDGAFKDKYHAQFKGLVASLNDSIISTEKTLARQQILKEVAYEDAIADSDNRLYGGRLYADKAKRSTKTHRKLDKQLLLWGE